MYTYMRRKNLAVSAMPMPKTMADAPQTVAGDDRSLPLAAPHRSTVAAEPAALVGKAASGRRRPSELRMAPAAGLGHLGHADPFRSSPEARARSSPGARSSPETRPHLAHANGNAHRSSPKKDLAHANGNAHRSSPDTRRSPKQRRSPSGDAGVQPCKPADAAPLANLCAKGTDAGEARRPRTPEAVLKHSYSAPSPLHQPRSAKVAHSTLLAAPGTCAGDGDRRSPNWRPRRSLRMHSTGSAGSASGYTHNARARAHTPNKHTQVGVGFAPAVGGVASAQ
jgi:hypothetical protein